jgi:YD repeat-containing protein
VANAVDGLPRETETIWNSNRASRCVGRCRVSCGDSVASPAPTAGQFRRRSGHRRRLRYRSAGRLSRQDTAGRQVFVVNPAVDSNRSRPDRTRPCQSEQIRPDTRRAASECAAVPLLASAAFAAEWWYRAAGRCGVS